MHNGGRFMARHYYRTNVPLPVMFLKWIGIGILGVLFAVLLDELAACFEALSAKDNRSPL